MSKKIGLSLSFCVCAVCRKEVCENDIEKLITGTRCEDEYSFEEELRRCRETYWRYFPDEATAVARRLWQAGKIVQPRLEDKARYPMIGGDVIWVDCEEEIVWSR